jgi:uncharacterized protein
MEWIITFFVFLFVMLFMAVGVLLGRKRIQGSCGGIASLGLEKNCGCESECAEHNTLYQIQEPTT